MNNQATYNRRKVIFITGVLLLLFLWAIAVQAQDIAAPVEVQLPIFLKILTFDRNLKARVGDEIIIGIVYQKKFRASLKTRDEIVDTINESQIKKVQDIPINQVSIDMDSENIETAVSKNKVDILYITPMRALEIEKIIKLSHSKKITTLTGVPGYVDAGIAVGIDLKDNQPRIAINLLGSKAEGTDFSSQLLKLAKVITK